MSLNALIVDDEPHILRVAELALKAIGCNSETAADGEQAWEKIQENCPDVLISDVQMPKLDGVQLVRLVRSTPEFADLPVILLTAKGLELQQVGSELVDNCDIITKPFSPMALSRRVYQILSAKVSEAAAD